MTEATLYTGLLEYEIQDMALIIKMNVTDRHSADRVKTEERVVLKF
jgi:hypothetical protein